MRTHRPRARRSLLSLRLAIVTSVCIALLGLPSATTGAVLQPPPGAGFDPATSDLTRQVTLWRAGSARIVARSPVKRRNSEISLQARLTRTPNASGALVIAYLRRSGPGREYRAVVRVTRDGGVHLGAMKQRAGALSWLGTERSLPWFRVTSRTPLMVRARVTGTSPTLVQIRVWLKGQREPAAWQYVVRDTDHPMSAAGTSGVRVAVGYDSTVLPLRVAVSDVRTRSVAAPRHQKPASRPSPKAPTISGIRVTELTTTGATVSWTVSEPATGQVEYGRTAAYGSTTELESSFDYQAHVQRIAGLAPGTTYHFRVRSRNQAGLLAVSSDQQFRTTGTPVATATPRPTATPAPNPTPTPAPGSTPRPTATPAPNPTPTPTAPPTGTVTVPASIDSSCGTNVGAALNDWIARQAAGSTLRFPSGSCYRLGGDTGISIRGLRDLTLVGTGATLQLRTTGASNLSSAFLIQDSTGITIRGFSVVGANTATATTDAETVINERINGMAIRSGTADILVDGVSLDRMFGFGIIISDDGDGPWPDGVTIRGSTVRGGEMGIAVTAGRHIDIVGNSIEDTVYTAIDLEPDQPQHGYQDVLISDNDVTNYGWAESMTSWFVAACPADSVVGSVTTDGLVITGNRIHRGAATANNGNFDGLGGLGIRIDKANLKRGVTITNNSTTDNDTQSSSRGVIYLANVQNLVVTGNTQPIANGAAFVRDTGTTGTRTVANNDTTP